MILCPFHSLRVAVLSELNNSIQMKESCLEGCKKVLLCFSRKKIFWSQWTNHFELPVDLVVESSYVLSRRKAEIETESTVNVSTHPSVLPQTCKVLTIPHTMSWGGLVHLQVWGSVILKQVGGILCSLLIVLMLQLEA